jgi:hypothetical protein
MQLAAGGDWPAPAANTMWFKHRVHIYICIHTHGSDFTRLHETWFSKNRSTKNFQALFRQVWGLELFGRTTLAFIWAFVSTYLMCKSYINELCVHLQA